MKNRTSLLAAVGGTIVVNFAYLMPQMAGAGALVRLLTGIPYNWAVVLVGISMIVYVAFGGMLATTWVQIVKAVPMLAAAALILLMVLSLIHFNPLSLFTTAEAKYGPQFLLPGNYLKNPFDQISLGLGYVFGLAGLFRAPIVAMGFAVQLSLESRENREKRGPVVLVNRLSTVSSA